MAASDGREPSYYEVALTNRQVLVAFLALLFGLLASFFAGVWVGSSRPPTLVRAAVEQKPAPPVAEAQKAAEPADDGVDRLTFFEAKQGEAEGEAANPTPVSAEPAVPESAAPAAPVGAEPAAPVEPLPTASAPPARDEPKPAAPATPGEGPRWTRRLARDAAQLEGEMAREEAELAAGKTAGESGGAARPEAPAPAPPAASPSAPAPAEPERQAQGPKQAPGKPTGAVFVVQVFSSKDLGKAREILGTLQEAGYPATLSRADQGMYRVRVGPYRDRAAAERSATDVNRKFKLDTWITSE